MGPARTGLWIAMSKGPWLVKPLWGFLSDAYPIAGYRRRSWLIIVNVIGAQMMQYHGVDGADKVHTALAISAAPPCSP